MLILGRVIDQQKNSIIQGATVRILNADGIETGVTGTSDEIGRFYINSPEITLSSIVEFSHPNYLSVQLPVTGRSDYGFVSMKEKPAQAARPADEPEPEKPSWLLWLVLAAAAVLILSKKKKSG